MPNYSSCRSICKINLSFKSINFIYGFEDGAYSEKAAPLKAKELLKPRVLGVPIDDDPYLEPQTVRANPNEKVKAVDYDPVKERLTEAERARLAEFKAKTAKDLMDTLSKDLPGIFTQNAEKDKKDLVRQRVEEVLISRAEVKPSYTEFKLVGPKMNQSLLAARLKSEKKVSPDGRILSDDYRMHDEMRAVMDRSEYAKFKDSVWECFAKRQAPEHLVSVSSGKDAFYILLNGKGEVEVQHFNQEKSEQKNQYELFSTIAEIQKQLQTPGKIKNAEGLVAVVRSYMTDKYPAFKKFAQETGGNFQLSTLQIGTQFVNVQLKKGEVIDITPYNKEK